MKIADDILCIIPARGGSKGIPNKNLRLLGGLSLVAHSIKHAKKAGLERNNIFVSSDKADILREAILYGAYPCARPVEISGDKSSTEECLIHALGVAEKEFNQEYNHVLLLQATSPIRFNMTIENFVNFYFNEDYDSCLTATEFHDFFWNEPESGRWESSYDPAKRPMRQDILKSDMKYFDNGNMYIVKSNILREFKSRLAGKVGVYPITPLEALQIDTPTDLLLLESVFDGTVNKLIEI